MSTKVFVKFGTEILKLIKKLWPVFIKYIWPMIKEYVIAEIAASLKKFSSIVFGIINDFTENINKKYKDRQNEAEKNAEQAEKNAKKADEKANDSLNDSEIHRYKTEAENYRAIANVWRVVFEDYRQDNEKLSQDIYDLKTKLTITEKLFFDENRIRIIKQNAEDVLVVEKDQVTLLPLPPSDEKFEIITRDYQSKTEDDIFKNDKEI